MAAKIDIRKISENGMEYYQSLDGPHDVLIAKLSPTKYFYRNCDAWATRFGKLVRRLAVDMLKARSHTKPRLCKTFKASARVYNLADSFAKSMVNSAIEAHIKALIALSRLDSTASLWFLGGYGRNEEPAKLRQRLHRVHVRGSKLDAFPEKPSIFIGGKRHFYNQHNGGDWKEKYIRARHDCFGARGSKDETCGNSTYQIRFARLIVEAHKVSGRIVPCNMYEFGVTSKGKKLGTFLLNEKESRKLRDCLSDNTALKVFFKRLDNGSWYIYTGYAIAEAPKPTVFNGVLGIDINNGHLEAAAVDNNFNIVQYWKESYDTECDKNTRERQLYAIIRKFVAHAKDNGYKLSLEYLDFEFCKRYLQNKLGTMLHVLPYRKIRKKFERECRKYGVELVYVKPEYSSVLGNLIASLCCKYSRDVAAAAVIALRAIEGGNGYLNKLCVSMKKLRLNVKGMFGRHIDIDDRNVEPMAESKGEPREGKIDTDRGVYAIQYATGRSLNKLMKVLSGIYYHDKSLGRIRTRWRAEIGYADSDPSNGCQIKSISVGCRSPDENRSTSKRLAKINEYLTESIKDLS